MTVCNCAGCEDLIQPIPGQSVTAEGQRVGIPGLLAEARAEYERSNPDERALHALLELTEPVEDTPADLALSLGLAHRDILAVIQMVEEERDTTDERFEKIERTLQRQAEFRTQGVQDLYRLVTEQQAQLRALRSAFHTCMRAIERLEGGDR